MQSMDLSLAALPRGPGHRGRADLPGVVVVDVDRPAGRRRDPDRGARRGVAADAARAARGAGRRLRPAAVPGRTQDPAAGHAQAVGPAVGRRGRIAGGGHRQGPAGAVLHPDPARAVHPGGRRAGRRAGPDPAGARGDQRVGDGTPRPGPVEDREQPRASRCRPCCRRPSSASSTPTPSCGPTLARLGERPTCGAARCCWSPPAAVRCSRSVRPCWSACCCWPALGGALAGGCAGDGGTGGGAQQIGPRSWSAEQTANAQTITQVAVGRGLPRRAAVIAVSTAIVESQLRNVALRRPRLAGAVPATALAGLGTPPRDMLNPVLAAGKFYDALVAVPRWALRPPGAAAQAVQRSAFPDALRRPRTGRRRAGRRGSGSARTTPSPGPARATRAAAAASHAGLPGPGWRRTAARSRSADRPGAAPTRVHPARRPVQRAVVSFARWLRSASRTCGAARGRPLSTAPG